MTSDQLWEWEFDVGRDSSIATHYFNSHWHGIHMQLPGWALGVPISVKCEMLFKLVL